MADRVQPVGSRASEPETAEVDLKRLPHLISGARASSGADRRALAGEINKILLAMRTPGHAEAETKLIVSALDSRALDDLFDDQGWSCRKEAVETLLASGFPHALNVAPEDLQFARSYVVRAPREEGEGAWHEQLKRNRRNGAAVVDGSQLLFLLILIFSGHRIDTAALVALVSGAFAMLTATLFASRTPNLDSQGLWGTVLAICAAAQLLTAFDVGAPALIGALGTVFGVLLAFSSQSRDSRDPG